MAEAKKRVVTLVDSTYQPTKAELEEPITVPEGMVPDDLAAAIMRPVEIQRTPRPELPKRGRYKRRARRESNAP